MLHAAIASRSATPEACRAPRSSSRRTTPASWATTGSRCGAPRSSTDSSRTRCRILCGGRRRPASPSRATASTAKPSRARWATERGGRTRSAVPSTTGPLRYTGQEAIASDIANLRAGLQAAGIAEGFLTSPSPGSVARIADEHSATEEEHIWAWAGVLREEYQAVIGAGVIRQVGDPSIAGNWDQLNPEPSVEEYRAFTRIRVEALNRALRGLPDATLVLPGVVGNATNVAEHPELVAGRIERFAAVVGPERVIGSTECGLGGRIHPQIAWAKAEGPQRGRADRLGAALGQGGIGTRR